VADNTQVPGGSGDTVRDKDRAGVKTQIVGIDVAIGTGTEALMSPTNPMPTKVAGLTLTTPGGRSRRHSQLSSRTLSPY